MNNKNIIYGLKTNNTYHYIGKTIKELKQNGKTPNSKITYQYTNSKLRKLFERENLEIEIIKKTSDNDWYDEKIGSIVKRNKHPLINASWLLDGKRGYWEGTKGYWYGKKKDQHTIDRLSESKHKKIVEYDTNGNLKKIWNSGREVGMKVFKDYEVVNGRGVSKIYRICDRKTIYRRLELGSYWFRYEELIDNFNTIPKKLEIDKIIENYIEERRKRIVSKMKQAPRKKYEVLQYNINTNEHVNTFNNVEEAAKELGIHKSNVHKYCNGRARSKEYVLKYGEKK